jgi:hypothetical protein
MNSESAVVGQAKFGLVVAPNQGVITSLHVRQREKGSGQRIGVIGEVQVDQASVDHIRDVIIAVVDRICQPLEINPIDYEVSVKGISATALHGLDLSVSGYSLDLALLLAALSSALQFPIPENMVFTGQVATVDGHFLPAEGIPAKLNAAAADPSVTRFIFAAVNTDESAKQLSPEETDRVRRAIIEHKDRLDIKAVRDLFELFPLVVNEEEVCLASLRSGYFDGIIDSPSTASPVGKTMRHLVQGNDVRFWTVVEGHLLKSNFKRAKELLHVFVEHYTGKRAYPSGFGDRLSQLMASIPPYTRRKPGLWPLVEMKDCLNLSQLASESDYHDVRALYRASFGETGRPASRVKPDAPSESSETVTSALLQHLVEELSAENVARNVLLPIDAARAGYVSDRVTVESFEEFLECVTAFYAHLLCHRGLLSGIDDYNQIGPDALELLRRSFSNAGEEKGAFAEAVDGTRGGLRYIYDEMTRTLKEDERRKYNRMVLKTAIDPLDFPTKTSLIKSLMEHLGSALPAEIRDQPPERYASDYELIIEAFVQSLDRLIAIIRLL